MGDLLGGWGGGFSERDREVVVVWYKMPRHFWPMW